MAFFCLEARVLGHAGCRALMDFDCRDHPGFLADTSLGSLAAVALLVLGRICLSADLGYLAGQPRAVVMMHFLGQAH